MHLLPERLIEWVVVGGWAAAQARRTTHGCVHACTGGWFTSAWWNLNPGGWQWWRNARMVGPAMALHVHHFWRPSTSENKFLSPNLVEPVADARLCCARAPAHRHFAQRRPRSELFTWQRLRCPEGSCIGKRGEGRWWVRSPANSRTRFSEGQKEYRKIGTGSLEPFEPLRGGASGGPRAGLCFFSWKHLNKHGKVENGSHELEFSLKGLEFLSSGAGPEGVPKPRRIAAASISFFLKFSLGVVSRISGARAPRGIRTA